MIGSAWLSHYGALVWDCTLQVACSGQLLGPIQATLNNEHKLGEPEE
jgi:hypothetical protein